MDTNRFESNIFFKMLWSQIYNFKANLITTLNLFLIGIPEISALCYILQPESANMRKAEADSPCLFLFFIPFLYSSAGQNDEPVSLKAFMELGPRFSPQQETDGQSAIINNNKNK